MVHRKSIRFKRSRVCCIVGDRVIYGQTVCWRAGIGNGAVYGQTVCWRVGVGDGEVYG